MCRVTKKLEKEKGLQLNKAPRGRNARKGLFDDIMEDKDEK